MIIHFIAIHIYLQVILEWARVQMEVTLIQIWHALYVIVVVIHAQELQQDVQAAQQIRIKLNMDFHVEIVALDFIQTRTKNAS